jgi:hypothetical protein
VGRSRRRKSLNDLRRKAGAVNSAPTVLILCEGEKTEPAYFAFFVKSLRLRTVDVIPAEGSAPMSIVTEAAARKKKRSKEAKSSTILAPYKHVYCVFDVDEHPNINSALEMARANNISVALSNPCFEYWLLLHFVRYGSTGLTRQRAVQELKRMMGEYEKGEDYGPKWSEKLAQAIKNANDHHRSQWQIDPSDPKKVLECCPSTGVHLLMEFLQGIAKSLTQPHP